jgi:lysozyme
LQQICHFKLFFFFLILGSDDCLEGVDVSHHNGAIDWATAQQSVQVKFAMIKATQGEKFVDPNFVANWNGALQNGISPHAYHYFIGNCSVSMQLKNIQNTLQQVKFNLDSSILAIDVEPMYNRGINVGY